MLHNFTCRSVHGNFVCRPAVTTLLGLSAWFLSHLCSHQENHCCSCETLPLWRFLLPEQHQNRVMLPSMHDNICMLRQASEGRGQRPFRRAGFSASMPQPAGPHATCPPNVQQLGIPMTAAPFGFTFGTWAADDKERHTTAMRKRHTGGGRITVGHNAALGQEPW